MKILCIGDLHGKLPSNVPKNADIILMTGDLGKSDLMRKMAFGNVDRKKKGLPELEYTPKQRRTAFMEAYNSSVSLVRKLSKIAPVFTIFGNVESTNPQTRREANEIGLKLPFLANDLNKIRNVRVLNNRLARYKSLRIGGLTYFVDESWVMEFRPSDYGKSLGRAKKSTRKVKEILNWFGKVNILITHQPPYGVLDKVNAKFAPSAWRGKHAGSRAILKYIKRYQPKYALCGHIHEGRGQKKVGKTTVINLGLRDYSVLEL